MWGGVVHPYIVASKNVKIINLNGIVKIDSPQIACVRLGFESVGIIDSTTNKLLWQNTGEIIFHEKASIGSGSKISCSGKLEFGKNFRISSKSAIVARKNIKFGDDCLISWDCLFMDTDFHKIYSMNTSAENCQINPEKDIVIGNHVWIGCRSTILKGTSIPDNCVIAAGSTVVRQYKEQNSIYAGNKILKNHISWQK